MTTGAFYALAISAATCRTVVRVRLGQGLEIDDGLLFLACICITTSTVLLYISISDVYLFEHLLTDLASASSLDDVYERSRWFRSMAAANEFVSKVAVFAIRASFLFFFRRLIDRLGGIITYWRVTVFVTAVTFFSTVTLDFIGK